MKNLFKIFDKKTGHDWGIQNEYIIAVCMLLFSLAVFTMYQGVVVSADNAPSKTQQTFIFVTIFPIFCAMRLVAVYRLRKVKYFGLLTASIDISLLSGIIYMFSQQYGTPAATLKSPSFAFYFVLIAIHAMRFNPKLILMNGAISVIAWATITLTLMNTTTDITHSYSNYVSDASLLLGAEIEKLFALTIFTVALAVGASRAAALHTQRQTAQEKLAEIRLQEELSQVGLNEEKRISRLKSEFLDTMSHELRTPMNGLMGMVQTLRMTPLNRQQDEMLKIMEKSSDHLTLILNNILDFAHISDDDTELKAVPFNLQDMVNVAIQRSHEVAQQRNIGFGVEIQSTLPTHLIGDSQRLTQILEHFLDNAVKFTQEGRVRLFIHGLNEDQNCDISFEVHDTGIGMERSHFKDIFKPFHQIDGSMTRKFGGTGMGLALCQRLVDIMKGEIIVQSISGLGSVFTLNLSLPIAENQYNEALETKQNSQQTAA